MYIYIYICNMCVYIYIYIHMYDKTTHTQRRNNNHKPDNIVIMPTLIIIVIMKIMIIIIMMIINIIVRIISIIVINTYIYKPGGQPDQIYKAHKQNKTPKHTIPTLVMKTLKATINGSMFMINSSITNNKANNNWRPA